MTESIQYRADLNHPFNAVYDAMTGRDSIERVIKQYAQGHAKLLKHGKTDRQANYTARVTVPHADLPLLARAVHSGDLTIVLDQDWTRDSDTHAAGAVMVQIDDSGEVVSAKTELRGDGDSTVWTVNGAVSVAGVMGKAVAGLIVDRVTELLGAEAGYLDVLLRSKAA